MTNLRICFEQFKELGGVFNMDIENDAQRMLEKYPLCDHCLGRQFAFLGQGLDNEERGKIIKTLLTMNAHKMVLSKDNRGIKLLRILSENGSFPMATEMLRRLKRRTKEPRKCFLCEGHFEELESYVEKAVEMLKEYEFETFLVGVKLPTEVEEREDEFKAELSVQYGESLRSEFSRVFGKMLCEKTGKLVNFANPHIVILVNPFNGEMCLQVNSLFIMGRYRKLVCGIPQTRWLCPKCKGEGCLKCGGKGRIYLESIEELIGEPTLEVTQGGEYSFHAAGREDVDVRMLGRGRPFIIQVKKPRKRKIDLSDLEKRINMNANGKIEVRDLRLADKRMVRRLKLAESFQKTYNVTVKFDREISDEDISKLKDHMTNIIIRQQTPRRVLRRRADKVREKKIYETKIKRLSPNTIIMRIKCQGGLYVKELVTGDNGRTSPSVSEIVGANAEPLKLDVMQISTRSERR